jgi:hypothetical protein
MGLTVQIVSRNDGPTIGRTLESLAPLGCPVVVLDRGSTDDTREVAADHAEVVCVDPAADRAAIRNAHLGGGWTLVVEPWEVLVAGRDAIQATAEEPLGLRRVMVSHGDMVTKEVRLLHRASGRFRSPVCEMVTPSDPATPLGAVLAASARAGDDDRLDALVRWQESRPADPEPLYYQACLHLAAGRTDEFVTTAERYLFRCETLTMPVALMRYYLAVAHCHVRRDATQAVQNILVPLALKPLMAEFWCLLGDVYFFLVKDRPKAGHLYRTALEMGRHRQPADPWPLIRSKYQEYPEGMLAVCRQASA